MEELIQRLVPKFYFHPDEQVFPCSIDEYFRHCDIAKYRDNNSFWSSVEMAGDIEEKVLQTGPFNQTTLSAYASTVTNWDNISLKLKDNPDSYNFQYKELDQKAPVYVNYYTKNNKLYINYSLMYALNLGKFLGAGFHQADIECVIFEINTSTLQPIRVFFSAHGSAEGRWVNWADTNKTAATPQDNTQRVKVYVANGSHGNHPFNENYVYFRIAGLGNDVTSDKGKTLIPQAALFDGDNITIFVPSVFNNDLLYLSNDSIRVDHRFKAWRGALGANSVRFPNEQGFYRSIDGYGTAPPHALGEGFYKFVTGLILILIIAAIVYLFRHPLLHVFWSGIDVVRKYEPAPPHAPPSQFTDNIWDVKMMQ